MSLLDTDLLLHTEGQYASANKNTCPNTHIFICCQQSQRWVISPMDYIKKKRQICPQVHCPAAFCPLAKAVPLWQGTFLQDYSPLQPGQDHYSLPALCLSITAQPSVRQPSTESSSHGWSRHWLLRTERRASLVYLTDARKTSVTFTYASANAIMQQDSTHSLLFVYMRWLASIKF